MRQGGLILALCLLVAGCGGEPSAPVPSSGPSATASPTPSSTPTGAPVLPEAATQNTKAGAIAFVKHYIELINYAQATGDTAALAAVDSKACKSCANARNHLDQIYAAGGHITGGEFSVAVYQAVQNAAFGDWAVFVGLHFAPETVVQPTRTPPYEHYKGGQGPATFFPEFRSTGWAVAEWNRGS